MVAGDPPAALLPPRPVPPLVLAVRLAFRELRGGLRGFRVFLACLALGVAALAAVGSLSAAIVAGLRDEARVLVGGDVEVATTGRPLEAAAAAYLRETGEAVSVVREMRAMARAGGRTTLVELKGVDRAYPLAGTVALDPPLALDEALAEADGRAGAVAEATLLVRLGLDLGDVVTVGDAEFVIRARIVREPDRAADAFVLGPRLMVGERAFTATGLVRVGSLVRHRARVRLAPGADVGTWVDRLGAAFPDRGWHMRDVRDSRPGVRRFVERFGVFLSLVGLAALVIGGIGVGNAVKGYLDGRAPVIAVLKCLGAPGALVFRVYLVQVLALAALGTAVGVALGGLAPVALEAVAGDSLPFPARLGVYPGALSIAAAYGLLTALAFTIWPLGRAREVPAAGLFRDLVAPARRRPRAPYIAAVAIAGAGLLGLALLAGGGAGHVRWFAVGIIVALAALRLAAAGLVRGAARLPRPHHAGLRLALANLCRPGAPTAGLLVSLGAGLSLLVAVALVEGNLRREMAGRIPVEAPAFFFIDIQPDQTAAFDRLLAGLPGVGEVERVPTLRGRLLSVNGVPAADVTVAPEGEWINHSEIGLTYRGEKPADVRLTAGTWWPADYAGPPLISLDDRIGRAMGIGPGDRMTFAVLGRPIEARIANLRVVDWSDFGLNFVVVFAPGALDGAPQMHVASVRVARDSEEAVYGAVTGTFANVTAVRVREVLETLKGMLQRIVGAVRAVAAVALLAGVLVLAGAVAAGHRQRVYDAVVLKVLGATRANVLAAFGLEFALIGAVAAAIAGAVGWVAAYVVITEAMGAVWTPLPGVVALTVIVGLVVTALVGVAGTWVALGGKAAPVLRGR